MNRWLAWARAELVHALASLGYWIRPYDMLSDRRRWVWQPRTCCTCGRPAYRRTHPRTTKEKRDDRARSSSGPSKRTRHRVGGPGHADP
jgi:hypothetical protein